MKRSLLIVFLIIFFSFVLGQQSEPGQDEYRANPPKIDEFPPVDRTCKTKQKLYVSTVAGNPAGSIKGSAMVSCQFHTLDCRGKIKWFKSTPAPGRQGICDSWVAARNAIENAAVESCCDPETTNEKPPADGERPPNCEPPASWFDNTAPCRDKRAPWVAIREGSLVLSICGVEVWRRALRFPNDPLWVEAYRQVLRDGIQRQVGSTVCCDKFREAVRTGVPCDPSTDLDCDGRPNQNDVWTSGGNDYPDINLYGRFAESPVAQFPSWADSGDPDFRPDRAARESKGVGECPCKWELIKGELKCSPDRRQRHVYLATWWCPTTKAEVITTKYAEANKDCP